jgi:hypothetical protein
MALLLLGSGVGVVTAKLKELAKLPPHNDRNGLPGTTNASTIQSMTAKIVKVIAAATKQPIRMLLDDAPACTTGTVVAAAVGV